MNQGPLHQPFRPITGQVAADPPPLDRSTLIEAYYPLVLRVARRLHRRLPSGVDLDDLASAGVIGLIEAVERYDPARGIAFEPYAKHRIQGAMLDALRATDWIPRAVRQRGAALDDASRSLMRSLGRTPTAAELSVHLALPIEAVHAMREDADAAQPVSLDANRAGHDAPFGDRVIAGEDPAHRYSREEVWRAMVAAAAALPERERQAIELFYFEDRSLREIGAVLGVTDSRVSQLCAQGIRRLRLALLPEPEST